ncbi:MAG: hypothetical protein L7F78_02885 [Syntrophales bacterium LBB04]|nr:hypothetical protein [Syntrophales bacterium LBB04]
MTISTYNIDSVISAYDRQSKAATRQPMSPEETKNATRQDPVSLSKHEADKSQTGTKTFASIIDLIMKDKSV